MLSPPDAVSPVGVDGAVASVGDEGANSERCEVCPTITLREVLTTDGISIQAPLVSSKYPSFNSLSLTPVGISDSL